MADKLDIGQIVEGKVTGIQPYGAFVAINDDMQGLVHISEITHGYVKDINEHLQIGDLVKVKVINIDEERNKISLSIRATQEVPKKKTEKPKRENHSQGFNTLKDKLEQWIDQSQEQIGRAHV